MTAIHQFVDTLVPGDAISNYCLQIQDYIKELGYGSKIYVRHNFVRRPGVVDYKSAILEDEPIIFHHSTYSPLVERVLELPNKKVLIYHNITPAAFFRRIDYPLYKIFKEAERQNFLFKNKKLEGIVGDSHFNLRIMQSFVKSAKVKRILPPFLSLRFSDVESSERLDKILQDGKLNILFVGRVAFNKRQDDVIKVFEYYSKFINPNSRLILSGTFSPYDTYCSSILKLISERNIQNVILTGKVSQEDLKSYYKNAHVFLSLSEHEGFCIPILESIHFKVPTLAYDIPAVRELLGRDFTLRSKQIEFIAELIDYLHKNSSFRKSLISRQRSVLNKFKEKSLKRKFSHLLKEAFRI